jgi:hypothetical protein
MAFGMRCTPYGQFSGRFRYPAAMESLLVEYDATRLRLQEVESAPEGAGIVVRVE